jgi:hypothetical protein
MLLFCSRDAAQQTMTTYIASRIVPMCLINPSRKADRSTEGTVGMRGLDRPLRPLDARFRPARGFDVEFKAAMIILSRGWLRSGARRCVNTAARHLYRLALFPYSIRYFYTIY